MVLHQFYFSTMQDAHRASHSPYFENKGRELFAADDTYVLQVTTYSPYTRQLASAIAQQIGATGHTINIDPLAHGDAYLARLTEVISQAVDFARGVSPQEEGGRTREMKRQFLALQRELKRIGLEV